jgi:YVTN family beta-propeller protein
MKGGHQVTETGHRAHGSGRLSRRHFLAGAAISAGAALLAACGGSAKATDTPAPTKAPAAAPTAAPAAATVAPTAAATAPAATAARATAPVGATTAASSASAPTTQAAIAMPKAYIGLFKDNAVAVFDTMANKVVRTIPIPTGPHGLVLTPDGKTVYASSDGATVVSIIDTATDKVTGSIEVGQAPHGLAITPDGKTVLVAGFGTNQVMVVDVATNTVVGQVPVPQPHNIAITPDGKTAYVAAQQQGATALAILSIAERKQTGSVPLDKTPRALNFDKAGTQLYFTLAGADAVQILDVATNKVTGQIAVGASPHHPLVTATGEYAMVVS